MRKRGSKRLFYFYVFYRVYTNIQQVAQRTTIAHLRTSKYFQSKLKIFSIGQGQPTLQSMVGQNSDVNKGRNSVANLQK